MQTTLGHTPITLLGLPIHRWDLLVGCGVVLGQPSWPLSQVMASLLGLGFEKAQWVLAYVSYVNTTIQGGGGRGVIMGPVCTENYPYCTTGGGGGCSQAMDPSP